MLTPKECAERVCVSLSLIYALLKKKKIPALRIGLGRGKWLIQEDDFEAFLANCKLEDLRENESEFKYL
jgi:excisionase family DNA binding protein